MLIFVISNWTCNLMTFYKRNNGQFNETGKSRKGLDILKMAQWFKVKYFLFFIWGWNDPPEFLHTDESSSNLTKKSALNKRVSHPFDGYLNPGQSNSTAEKLSEPPKMPIVKQDSELNDKVPSSIEEKTEPINQDDIENCLNSKIDFCKQNKLSVCTNYELTRKDNNINIVYVCFLSRIRLVKIFWNESKYSQPIGPNYTKMSSSKWTIWQKVLICKKFDQKI